MESLPTEVLVLVFEYLRVGEILECVKVCETSNSILRRDSKIGVGAFIASLYHAFKIPKSADLHRKTT